jgi:phosphatidylglycerol:prolipoprotein diacylglycerol transferase
MIFDLSPYLFQVGEFGLRYYSLAYLVGVLITYLWLTRIAKYDAEKIADFCLYGFLAIVIGGRLGYVFFYQPQWIWTNPLEIVKIWQGGMSIHGGIALVALWVFYYVRKQQWNFFRFGDALVVPAMFGIGLSKIGNFMNGELWGRLTDVPWCFIFPGAEGCRHPSQLYEAGSYFLLFLLLAWCSRGNTRPGTITALFLITLGLARTTIEIFFREPSWVYWNITAGTWLSIPMITLGIGLFLIARRKA